MLLLLVLLSCQQSSAGHMETVLTVPGSGYYLGSELAGGEHLDFDSVPDFICIDGLGLIAFTGATGQELYRIIPPTGYYFLRCDLIGDVNFDGASEILAVEQSRWDALVYSGLNGVLLYTITGNPGGDVYSLCRTGDLDRDGAGDFLLSHPFLRNSQTGVPGVVTVHSGRTGALIRTHRIQDNWSGSTSGKRVAAAGDVDQDAVPDYLIGSPFTANSQGSCTVISGASGGVIRTITNPNPWLTWFGASVANAGDCDGDSIPDQAVNTLYAWSSRNMISVFSGADGRLLWQIVGLAPLATGYHMVGGIDHDGDGHDDLATAEPSYVFPNGRSGAVHILSGVNGEFLATRYGGSDASSFGRSLAILGDLDGDGRPELGASSPYWDNPLGNPDAGRIEAFSWFPGLTADTDRVSSTRGGTVQFQLDFPRSQAGQPYALLASGTGAGPTLRGEIVVPLTPDAVLIRSATHPPAVLVNTMGTLDNAGDAACALVLPRGGAAGSLGMTYWFSAVTGPLGNPLAASIVKTVTILP